MGVAGVVVYVQLELVVVGLELRVGRFLRLWVLPPGLCRLACHWAC